MHFLKVLPDASFCLSQGVIRQGVFELGMRIASKYANVCCASAFLSVESLPAVDIVSN